jgi:hypothetical protein
MPRIVISLHLGPMVKIDIEGASCPEIAEALAGFEKLNDTVDSMFSDLARRVFPEGVEEDGHAGEEAS